MSDTKCRTYLIYSSQEVDKMKKQTKTLENIIQDHKAVTLRNLISVQDKNFESRFGFKLSDEVKVNLIFNSRYDAEDFYNELRFNEKYARQYKVMTNLNDSQQLIVSGSRTLFDYFGTKEPNLLTASRDLNIQFKVEYQEAFTQIIFTGEVIAGELLGRQCIVEYNELIPELTLSGLKNIASNQKEFDALLTRVYCVNTVPII